MVGSPLFFLQLDPPTSEVQKSVRSVVAMQGAQRAVLLREMGGEGDVGGPPQNKARSPS